MPPKKKTTATAAAAAAAAATPAAAAAAGAPAEKKSTGKLKVGDMCPDFTLVTEEGTSLALSDVWKTSGLIIFMYPKANTPGCTKQACGFRDHHTTIEQAGYKVFGLSTDNPTPQKNWKSKQKLPYTLLCDPKREAIGAFGAASAGKTVRSHVVIEKGGRVRDVQIKVSPDDSVKKAVALVSP